MLLDKQFEKLDIYIYENNITVDCCSELDQFNKSALYCNLGGDDIILLNPSLDTSDKGDKLEILSEECGHHATSVGDSFLAAEDSATRIYIDKTEKKATIWAAKYLIDLDDLRRYVLISGSVEELTDYLGVTYNILYEYLYNLKNHQQFLQITENKKLDLYKLPNLHIIERSDENEES